MKRNHLFVATLLAVVLSLFLCACGASKQNDFIGTWGSEIESNGIKYYNEFVLNSDGTFTKEDYQNDKLIGSPSGTYEVDGDTVTLHVAGTTRLKYTYKDSALYNGTRAYTKK